VAGGPHARRIRHPVGFKLLNGLQMGFFFKAHLKHGGGCLGGQLQQPHRVPCLPCKV
jgi:hypothetical protein